MVKGYSEEQGQALVKLARKTIENALGLQDEDCRLPENPLNQDAMREKRGVFVTLTRHGQLRGCIGFLEARESVVDAVRHNAINAAFSDPRFPPLNDSEIADIDIEVSILTEPKILEYDDSFDLSKKLKPGIDGVIIRYGLHSATFLPQVWEQLPGKEEFLSHLCLKAGLPANAWEKSKLDVLTYQVEYFEEKMSRR
jgi:AmmeMemoRadiSam system protein A